MVVANRTGTAIPPPKKKQSKPLANIGTSSIMLGTVFRLGFDARTVCPTAPQEPEFGTYADLTPCRSPAIGGQSPGEMCKWQPHPNPSTRRNPPVPDILRARPRLAMYGRLIENRLAVAAKKAQFITQPYIIRVFG